MLTRGRCVARISNFSVRRFGSFENFAKLKDSSDGSKPDSASKRKPTERVLRLVDEILNLSLIEAADLCDICSERLGGSAVTPSPLPFFGNFSPMQQAPPTGFSQPPPPSPAQTPAAKSEPQTPPEAPKTEEKSVVSIKIVAFDAARKVQAVKEVRAMTALGLKEAKDAVEAAPKVLKKGVSIAEAKEWKKKLEEAGATIELE
jgi:large subunit ribosomal protein L7/L12